MAFTIQPTFSEAGASRGLGHRVLGDRGVALVEFSKPAFILNGNSLHVKEAEAHIARIAGEFGVKAQVVVTQRGDDISALAARALRRDACADQSRAPAPVDG